jgi:hypothetical protein
LQVQPDALPQLRREPALLPGPAQPVLLREAQEHAGPLEPEARVLQPQEQEGPPLVPRVSLQPADVRELQAEEQVQPLVAPAAAQPLLLPLLSPRAQLPQRSRHPRHPADVF